MSSDPQHWDIVVVGSGPAGIAAACEAAKAGCRVALLDSQAALGGQIWHDEQHHPTSKLARRWFSRIQALDITVFPHTTAVAVLSAHRLLTETSDGPLTFAWDKLILATGARELFIPFPGWTTPHVMGVGGLQSLVKSGWPVEGKHVVLAGSGPLLLAVAKNLKKAGAHVRFIAEQTPWRRLAEFGRAVAPHISKLWQGVDIGLNLLGVPYRCGWWPIRAQGENQVTGVTLSNGHKERTIPCDVLACAFGLVPNIKLARLLGCAEAGGFIQVDSHQHTSCSDIYGAGELTGIGGVDSALVEGRIAGLCAAGQQDRAKELFSRRRSWRRFQSRMERAFVLRDGLKELAMPDTVICRCEDINYSQLASQGNWHEAKLYTRCGMGSCQGCTCGATLQFLFGWSRESDRPPVLSTPIKTLIVD